MPAVVIAKADDEIADLIDRVRSSADLGCRARRTGLQPRLADPAERAPARPVQQPIGPPDLDRHRGSARPAARSRQRAPGLRIGPGLRTRHRAGRPSGRRRRRWGEASRCGRRRYGRRAPCWSHHRRRLPCHRRSARPLTLRRPRDWNRGGCSPSFRRPRPPRGWDRRRFLYVAGAAVAIIGIVLFMALAPSAKVTITIAATPLSVSSTIQGTTSPAVGHARPTTCSPAWSRAHAHRSRFRQLRPEPRQLPAVAAKVDLAVHDQLSERHLVHATAEQPELGQVQTADQSVTFAPARNTFICIGPTNPPPAGALRASTSVQRDARSYVDQTAGAHGERRRKHPHRLAGRSMPGNPIALPGTHISCDQQQRQPPAAPTPSRSPPRARPTSPTGRRR